MHVMTKEQAAKFRIDFLRATEKWDGLTFKHFTDYEENKRHEEYVKKLQDSGQVPF